MSIGKQHIRVLEALAAGMSIVRIWQIFNFGQNNCNKCGAANISACIHVYMCVCVCELWPTNICVNLRVDMFIIRKLIPLFTYQMWVAANWFSARAFQAESSAMENRKRCETLGKFFVSWVISSSAKDFAMCTKTQTYTCQWQKLNAMPFFINSWSWQLNFNCNTFQSEITNEEKKWKTAKVEKLTKINKIKSKLIAEMLRRRS